MKKLKRDTDKTKTTRYNQHGRMESHVDNNILINEATGPFNAEIITAIQVIQHDLLQEIINHEQWAQVYIFHESVLCSPDTIEALRTYLANFKDSRNKPVATAFVMGPEVEGSSMMGPHYRQVYEEVHLTFQLFSTKTQALAWVNTMLAQA
ncbi:hypothetical protein AAKU67_002972 [Oxalobacteraceae bacterium GrIS 2.11]